MQAKIYPVTAEMYAAAERRRESPRSYLGMSSIGDPCEAKLWYGFRGFVPEQNEGRVNMIFELGNRVEDAIINWLDQTPYKVTGRQLEFADMEGMFRGHCDGIIEGISVRPHILEIKSANQKKFELYSQSGVCESNPLYAAQVQCYMGYSRLERALFMVMNKNNCEIYTERVYFDSDEFERLKEKAKRIISTGSISDLDMEKTYCKWCGFRFSCHVDEDNVPVPPAPSCVSCYWLHYHECKPYCMNEAHRFPIKDRSLSCPEYWFIHNDCPFPAIRE